MERRALVGTITVAAVAVVAAGAGLWWYQDSSSRAANQAATAEVQQFATAWQKRSFTGASLRFAGTTGQAVATAFATATRGLGSGPVSVQAGAVSRQGDRATSTLHVTWTLSGAVVWSYDVPATVVKQAGGWAVQLPTDRSAWNAQLGPKDRLTASRTWGPRGNLLDRSGVPLAPMGKVYPVQIDPTRATPLTATALEAITQDPAGSLVAKLAAAKKAGSQAPIPVVTYRQADFDARRAALDALVGVVYPVREQPLAKTRTFAQPLLGSFGPVSAELITSSKGRYAVGDYAGTSGLQGKYDALLGGTPGIKVTSSGAPSKTLFEKAPVAGTDVKTTLDPTVQDAAEAALQSTGAVPSALVAVDVKTGDVMASANSPALGFDRAMTGHYPPGSAFKIVTSYGLLTTGKVTPNTPVTCPQSFVVDGRTYKNYESETLASPTFTTDFAHSCNTAFVQLSTQLADDELNKAATALGLTGWASTLGVGNAFDAKAPVSNGKTDKASGAIGQGRNVVSPLALAVLAANIARGSAIAPALVTTPAPAGADRTPKPLDATAIGQLQGLMGEVVTQGTGQALIGTPGGTVRGKTGTAEFGSANPPQTHAWFVGYQGNLAFAVLVEVGKSGGTVAAPVARAFLTRLAHG
ncbi:MAG TPA: penicillin-binding transpeptidase domain-containing protein [Pedococcus sp.]|jgi:cell division protein FtsI/penicillin-binding protein 2|nr:penicillin-binding transpeptidase domain-containing protein [Pedococcus sp.]